MWDGRPDGARPGTGGSGGVSGNFPVNGSNRQKLDYASNLAREMGLRITSTTGGKHTPGSYHYRGRAIDVAGSPAVSSAYGPGWKSVGDITSPQQKTAPDDISPQLKRSPATRWMKGPGWFFDSSQSFEPQHSAAPLRVSAQVW